MEHFILLLIHFSMGLKPDCFFELSPKSLKVLQVSFFGFLYC